MSALTEYRFAPTAREGVLGRAVTAEWLRVKSTRTWWGLLLAAMAMPAVTTLGSVSTVGKPGGLDVTTAQGLHTALSNGFDAALLAAVLGVLIVTTEYRYRTAGDSLTLLPERRWWLLAKALVAAPLGLLFTVAGQATVLAVGLPVLSAKGVHVDPLHGELLSTLWGTCLLGPFAAVFGVGVGALVRNQVAAVAGLVIYTFLLEGALVEFVPAVGKYLPGGAIAAIAVDPGVRHLPMAAGFLLYAAWAAVCLAAGNRRLNSQDIAG
ncbi:ABC transporter permease [Streptomyces sp. NPDC092296]|uniref:ABC transporter permease n=1 Tax=Streptomyces sp. NPDC092296 TaxID=3366012 RepID=UPI0037F262B0